MHDTNGARNSETRKRVRMDCAFGHLTVGPVHNGPVHETRRNEAGLSRCATMGHALPQDLACGATAALPPVVIVRRRMRTAEGVPR